MAKLAREIELGLPLGPGAVTLTADGGVEVLRPPPASRHHFFLDGLLFYVSITPNPTSTLLQVWAEIGYMPYSIESPEKRSKLTSVLRATKDLTMVRFVVDDQQKIMMLAQQDVSGTLTLQGLMYELTQFLQEARPFLKVFGQYLET
jgi:hypothetical protein